MMTWWFLSFLLHLVVLVSREPFFCGSCHFLSLLVPCMGVCVGGGVFYHTVKFKFQLPGVCSGRARSQIAQIFEIFTDFLSSSFIKLGIPYCATFQHARLAALDLSISYFPNRLYRHLAPRVQNWKCTWHPQRRRRCVRSPGKCADLPGTMLADNSKTVSLPLLRRKDQQYH